jgi:hypothetical protein
MRIEKLFFALMIGFLVAVVGYCALCNDITHDEAYTWFIAQYSLRGAMLMEDPNANNHILNTIFVMLFSDRIFGAHEWAVRVGALTGFVIYIYAAYNLVLFYFKTIISRISAFLLFFSNPYLIEFFSLGRGYSLSIGLMLLSVYHFQNTKSKHYLWWSFGAAALGVYANFTLLPYFLCLFAVYFLNFSLTFLKNKTSLAQMNFGLILEEIKPVLSVCALLFVFIAIPIYQLKTHNQLYYGGEVGLWSDTIKSLAETLIYSKTSPENTTLVAQIALAIFGLSWSLVFYKKIKIGIALSGSKNQILLVFTAVLIVLWFLFTVLATKLVIYRTALFLYPLFVAAVLATISSFEGSKLYQKASFIVFLPFALLLTAHTIVQKRATLNSYRDWQSDAETERVYTKLYEQHALSASANDTLKVDAFWLHEITGIFYSAKHKKTTKILPHYKIGKPNWAYPYFIIQPEEYPFYKDSANIFHKGRYLWLLRK